MAEKTIVDAEVGYGFGLVSSRSGSGTCSTRIPTSLALRSTLAMGPLPRTINNNFGTFPWAAASPFGYNGRYVYARTEIQFSR